jgi:type III secretory pathway component EscV
MKKRWLLNFLLLFVVVGLITFLYVRPKQQAEQDTTYEISNYKLAEFNAVSVEFPTKAAVTFEKVAGFWRLTAPVKMRADQPSVQHILSIIAAKSKDKIAATDLEKFGLNNPSVKLKLFRDKSNVEEFAFGTHNPVTEEQYVLHRNNVYLVANGYSEAASTQIIELIDKTPLKPSEKVAGFDFSHLEQWQDSRLQVDLVGGKWSTSIAVAKPQQNEMNEWLDFSWLHNPAKSVDFYTPDHKVSYPSFEVKLADGSKVHFDKIQESPDLLLARPDEGLVYNFPSDAGFTMLNPPINLPSK